MLGLLAPIAFDAETRYEISQDPLNLLAVEGQANQDKLQRCLRLGFRPTKHFNANMLRAKSQLNTNIIFG